MFSSRLERLRQFNRLAVLAAATLLAVGIALIAVLAVRAFNMLGAAGQTCADHNRGAHRIGRSCRPVPYRLRRSPGCRTLHID